MKDETVICDGCGADITFATNSVEYRLQLQSVNKNIREGCVTDVMIYPHIDTPKNFCGLGCLKAWMEGEGWK